MIKKIKKNPVKESPGATTTKQYTFFEDVYAVVRQIPKGRVTVLAQLPIISERNFRPEW